jgi:hypothetical protein
MNLGTTYETQLRLLRSVNPNCCHTIFSIDLKFKCGKETIWAFTLMVNSHKQNIYFKKCISVQHSSCNARFFFLGKGSSWRASGKRARWYGPSRKTVVLYPCNRPWRPTGLWEFWFPHFLDIGSQMAVRSSALHAGCILPPRKISGTYFC